MDEVPTPRQEPLLTVVGIYLKFPNHPDKETEIRGVARMPETLFLYPTEQINLQGLQQNYT